MDIDKLARRFARFKDVPVEQLPPGLRRKLEREQGSEAPEAPTPPIIDPVVTPTPPVHVPPPPVEAGPPTDEEVEVRSRILLVGKVRDSDASEARDLASKVSDDIGKPLTGTEAWPAVQTWRTLNNVKRNDVNNVSGVMQIIVWMVPAMLRTARLARKAYRLASGDTSEDPAAD